MACAAIGLVLTWWAIDSKGGPVLLLAAVVAIVVGAEGVRFLHNINTADDEIRKAFGDLPEGDLAADPGWGLWVMLIAATVALLGCAVTIYKRAILGRSGP